MTDRASLKISQKIYRKIAERQRRAAEIAAIMYVRDFVEGFCSQKDREQQPAYEVWQASAPINQLPERWKEEYLDGQAFVDCFPSLYLKQGYATRCFRHNWGAGSRAKVFVVPEKALFEPVVGEPTLETVPAAIEKGQRMLEGDGGLQSYYEAAMLERAFSRVGAFWHGMSFDCGEMIVKKPRMWNWKVHERLPWSILPTVRETDEGVEVVYYAYKEYYGEALLKLVVEFERGCYLPDTTIYEVATGGSFIVV